MIRINNSKIARDIENDSIQLELTLILSMPTFFFLLGEFQKFRFDFAHDSDMAQILSQTSQKHLIIHLKYN